MFTEKDLQQLAQRGITPEQAEAQLHSFETGFPALDITAAASVGNGILKIDDPAAYLAAWEQYLHENHTILKFVPASGAASRMFKNLFEYLENGEETPFIQKFLSGLKHFAFYDELKQLCPSDAGQDIVRTLLETMHYGNLPKGLLKFHSYEDGARTPALEHMVEGALYAKNEKQEVNLHFTVSAEHRALFEEHIAANKQAFEKKYGVHYNVSFSEQKPSTDTIAADMEGKPFRTADGKLLFRPGGHGALIANLGEQDADVVFIKNIDNVVPDRLKEPTILYKKILAGILVTLQKQIFAYLKELEGEVTADRIEEMKAFCEEKLFLTLPIYNKESLIAAFNRPIRVCGMVKNEGEPGGGPFLVRDAQGAVQDQILESVQIADPNLMKQATHFNPVDLVCAIKDYKGERFCLQDYVDPLTGFISQKSKDGRELQALELPGLWNGAMARWNTVFAEVPIETFNPVKTVNDLLRDQHQ